jgi:antitoxin (DNA-binding transcriptional repressor) of toxin-antitoxin stability system
MLGIPYETVRGWLRDRQDPWSRRHEILRARDGSGSRRAEVAGVGAFRRRLAEHLRRVRTRREPLFIARRGRIVAAVIPVGADDVEAVEAFCDAIRWLNPPPGSGRS